MKNYLADFFTYFGCVTRQAGNILIIELIPELADYFGKSTLRLVFHPDHLEKQAELVTHGSYILSRMYDWLQAKGGKVSVLLPRKHEAVETALHGINCTLHAHRSREIPQTESYLVARLTYASDEKIEELVMVRRDIAGQLHLQTEFPYAETVAREATTTRFPFTQKQAREVYEQSLAVIREYAEEQAAHQQQKLAQHIHDTLTRLNAYYQQMIEEVPALEQHRDTVIQQLQQEYDIKIAGEVKKCQMQVTVTPLSFCAVTIPFRRDRFIFRTPSQRTTMEVNHNLFSGEVLLPRCDVCQQEMNHIGICEVKAHAVCRNCLIQCHVCGKHVCRNCGIDVCFECGEYVCRVCSQRCHLCGETYCAQHLVGCLICREYECRQCSQVCEVCGKPVGKIHLTACEISYKLACPTCMRVCSCCGKRVIADYIRTCAYCGQQMCTDCTFRCAVCGQEFCAHHISTCEATHQMVCSRHIAACRQCGRQVSTTLLKKCDVCRKPLCADCSQSCHHCGHVFCQEHAEELIPCPECGTLYCALCTQHVCQVCTSKGKR